MGRTVCLVAFWAGMFVFGAAHVARPSVAAEENFEEPILQQEPFDRLTLIPQYGSAVVKIKRLPVRELPTNPKPTDRLQVQLLSEPDKTYEVSWAALAKVELYEQIVLDEAKAAVAAGKLEEAYELFRYLEGNHPKLPGLAEAVEDYLFEEAKVSMRQRDYAGALAMLRELHRRNPKRSGLEAAMGVATERAVAEAVARGRYAAARGLWQSLRECFRDHPKAVAGEEQLRAKAAELLERARQAAESDPAAAGRLCREIDQIWPSLPGAKAFAEELHQRWPTVVVGCVRGTTAYPSDSNDRGESQASSNRAAWYVDWSARRDARLLLRPLCEFVAPGVAGGEYRSAVGTLASGRDQPVLTLNLAPEHSMLDADGVIAHWAAAVARTARGQPGDIVAEASVYSPAERRVVFHWPRRFPRIEALMAAAYRDVSLASSVPETWRPYRRGEAGSVFELNPAYFDVRRGTPRQIVVRHFETSAAAVKSLRAGEIAAVDRIAAAEVESLKADKRFHVGIYRVPTVHAVLVNSRRGPTAQREFRRALSAALDRTTLSEELGAGERRVLSGPFPLGIGPDDPIRYAVNPNLPPITFDPVRALAILSALEHQQQGIAAVSLADKHGPEPDSERREQVKTSAESTAAASAEQQSAGERSPTSTEENTASASENAPALVNSPVAGSGDSATDEEHYAAPAAEEKTAAGTSAGGATSGVSAVPKRSVRTLPWKLVLAYPPDETAKQAAEQLASQWQWFGLGVELKPLPTPTARVPEDCDLLYVVYAMCEPLADAFALFNTDGLDLPISPLRQLALRRLEEAASFEQARDALHALDQVCREEAALIPLFQSVEYYATRADLKGIDKPALSLYDFIEHWQPAFTWSEF